jgi:hypothetical protein
MCTKLDVVFLNYFSQPLNSMFDTQYRMLSVKIRQTLVPIHVLIHYENAQHHGPTTISYDNSFSQVVQTKSDLYDKKVRSKYQAFFSFILVLFIS